MSPYSASDLSSLLDLPTPTAEQRAMIEAPADPVVVVAGAGSGKTETMAARVLWNVANKHVQPAEVLGLTFTRKATGELAVRLRKRLRMLAKSSNGELKLDLVAGAPTVLTYHSYAQALVAAHGLRVGVEPGSALLTQAAVMGLARDVVDGYHGDVQELSLSPAEVTRALVAIAGECAEHLVNVDDIAAADRAQLERWRGLPGNDDGGPFKPPSNSDMRRAWAALVDRQLIIPMLQQFAARKRELRVLDFGDLVAIAVDIVKNHEDVVAAEREKFRLVLLDEFQDTSYAQLTLLSTIFGQGTSVTAVGDPNQSIYAWRGASPSNLAAFTQKFTSRDRGAATALNLSRSWRNDTSILEAANAIATPLNAASSIRVLPLTAREGAGSGAVAMRWCQTEAAEAKTLAAWIKDHWDRGNTTAAVLCRARSQFDAISEALAELGLPSRSVGGGGLITSEHVGDVVAVLRLLVDPNSGPDLARLLLSGRFAVTAADVHALGGWAKAAAQKAQPDEKYPEIHLGMTLDALADESLPAKYRERFTPEGAKRLAELARILRALRRSRSRPLTEVVSDVVRLVHSDIEAMVGSDVPLAESTAALSAFFGHVKSYVSSAPCATLTGFVDWLSLAQDHERGLEDVKPEDVAATAGDSSFVTISTVHAAKGLEWDIVAMPGWTQDKFPTRVKSTGPGYLSAQALMPDLRGDKNDIPLLHWDHAASCDGLRGVISQYKKDFKDYHIEEERRLAYVAVTRAKSALLLTGSEFKDLQVKPDGGVEPEGKPRSASDFWDDIAQLPSTDCLSFSDDGADDVMRGVPTTGTSAGGAWPQSRDGGVVAQAALAVRTYQGTNDRAERERLWRDTSWAQHVAGVLDSRRGQDTAYADIEHVSASHIGTLASNPEEFFRAQRRPVPSMPLAAADLGTTFHAWVEKQLLGNNQLTLLDEAEAEDEPAELAEMKKRFLASPWASRRPVAVEEPIEFARGGVAIRGRIDAVYKSADGVYELVDWKSGKCPTGARRKRVQWQLIAYREAWMEKYDIPADAVRCFFYYAGDDGGNGQGTTVPLEDPMPCLDDVLAEYAKDQR